VKALEKLQPSPQPARSQRGFQQCLQSRDYFSNCRVAAAWARSCVGLSRQNPARSAPTRPSEQLQDRGVRLRLSAAFQPPPERELLRSGGGAGVGPVCLELQPPGGAEARPAPATQQQLCSCHGLCALDLPCGSQAAMVTSHSTGDGCIRRASGPAWGTQFGRGQG